jgi:hypothetical protein
LAVGRLSFLKVIKAQFHHDKLLSSGV